MQRAILLIVMGLSPLLAQGNTIYKCMKEGKVIFSQNACPDDFSQHKIEYQLGITTETDTDKKVSANDPLRDILNSGGTISAERIVQLIDGELYRLRQENSYFDIIRVSELQKLERKRYWEKKQKTDPAYSSELSTINQRYDELIALNFDMIKRLSDKKVQVLKPITEETP
jgi:hypothetical protein